MIKVHSADAVARITLNAAPRHNALDQGAITRLTEVLDTLPPATRVVVLTGTGKSFCAGAALGDVAENDWTENPLTMLCDRLEAVPQPTICALNGGVYGGGVELAIACDFRIGVEDMRAFVPPAELGIHYPPRGLARSERLLGLQATRRMFLCAEKFDAAELVALGFLDQVVPADDLMDRVSALAQRLADLAPLAVQGMKQSLYEIGRGEVDTAAASTRIAACFSSDDHAEGLAARADRRSPRFIGR